MASLTYTINADGTLTPSSAQVQPGDSVVYTSPEIDAVLCVEDDRLYGAERYTVVQGSQITLEVQADAPATPVVILVLTGDLEASCGGSRGGKEQVGPTVDRSGGGG